jgi:hypothetical protein
MVFSSSCGFGFAGLAGLVPDILLASDGIPSFTPDGGKRLPARLNVLPPETLLPPVSTKPISTTHGPTRRTGVCVRGAVWLFAKTTLSGFFRVPGSSLVPALRFILAPNNTITKFVKTSAFLVLLPARFRKAGF